MLHFYSVAVFYQRFYIIYNIIRIFALSPFYDKLG